ncbi:N-myc-interactor [Menidia menidia]
MDGGPEVRSLQEAKEELKTWRVKLEKADDMKARLILEKLEEADNKAKAQQEMMAYLKKQEKIKEECDQSMKVVQDEIQRRSHHNQALRDELRRLQAHLEAQRGETTKLKQKFKIRTQIPDTQIKFVSGHKEVGEEDDNSCLPIRGVFTICQIPAVCLQGGQALVTFEEEKVASQILKLAKCSVSCDSACVDVRPRRVIMDSAVKYQVCLDVSRKKLEVSNIPTAMPEDRLRDRLEMSFSKPSRGGDEVEQVDYDQNSGTGCITFLRPGAAEKLAMRKEYNIRLDSEVKVKVGPAFEYQLNKFQTFCGITKRTILLEGIKDVADEEDLQDHIEIHFQKPSNSGGEIESIKYISKGKARQAFFSEDTMDN